MLPMDDSDHLQDNAERMLMKKLHYHYEDAENAFMTMRDMLQGKERFDNEELQELLTIVGFLFDEKKVQAELPICSIKEITELEKISQEKMSFIKRQVKRLYTELYIEEEIDSDCISSSLNLLAREIGLNIECPKAVYVRRKV